MWPLRNILLFSVQYYWIYTRTANSVILRLSYKIKILRNTSVKSQPRRSYKRGSNKKTCILNYFCRKSIGNFNWPTEYRSLTSKKSWSENYLWSFYISYLGHSLGIDHHWNPDSIMHPINRNYVSTTEFDISDPDVDAVQELYGNLKFPYWTSLTP